jgi:prepilin peptidase CpaA
MVYAMTVSVLTAPAGMVVFAFTMVYAGLTDVTTMKIRNRLVVPFFLAYVVLAPLAGFSLAEIGWSFAVAAGVLVLAFGCFAVGWIGGGDAKLLAVTALWFGADHTAAYLLVTALLGGAFTLGVLLFRMQALPAWLPDGSWIARLHAEQAGVPYGVAMALAGLVVFPATPWMIAMP